MMWTNSFENVDKNEEVEDRKWDLDIFFFKKLNLIKSDIASYELNIIVNELERIVIRCTQYGGQETR